MAVTTVRNSRNFPTANDDAPVPDVLLCHVCYNPFNSANRKPLDLGCGHCFCAACFSTAARTTFKSCPECRVPVKNPHVSYALLRVVSELGPVLSTEDLEYAPRATTAAEYGGFPRSVPACRHKAEQATSSSVGSWLHPMHIFNTVVDALIDSCGCFALQRYALRPQPPPAARVVAQPGVQVKSFWESFWPLLVLLYVLSPLDMLPDFIPILGWIDDWAMIGFLIWKLLQTRKMQ